MITIEDIKILNSKYHFMCDIWSSEGYAVKSNIAVKDKRLHCCSKVLENYISTFDATAVSRLKDKGILPAFSTNMDEFAMGSFSNNDMFGQTRNITNYDQWSSGGSSGGSAVAVALDLVPFALGSDTGGSVRLPASYCNISGFKPSYGAISRFGLVAYASSLDTIGILSSSVETIKKIFDIIKGYDKNDMQTATINHKDIRDDNTIAYISEDLISSICTSEVLDCYKKYLVFLKSNFNVISLEDIFGKEIAILLLDYMLLSTQYYYDIACIEAFSNLKRFNGLRYMDSSSDVAQTFTQSVQLSFDKFGSNIQTRIKRGEKVLTDKLPSMDTLHSFRLNLNNILQFIYQKVNFLFMPTNISQPFNLTKTTGFTIEEDLFLSFVNLAGLCAITIKSGNNMGIQLVGDRGDDNNCLEVSSRMQKLFGDII